ncbi:MAG: peptide deformylase [Alphaproteobacteria bacterium]|nr:peptide deformylase [Alphaproteobacteria bacterium]
MKLPFYMKGILLSCLFLNGCKQMPDLPPYVVLNDPKDAKSDVLRKLAEPLTFPLSREDREIVQILTTKFDSEENCAGLAAPQIGFSKQIIIFAVNDDPLLKKWRADLVQTMPKTLWINPNYEPIGKEKHTDYEACFSVDDLAGPVARFKTIRYSAYTPEGIRVEGTAKGFLARLIQHEIDHLKGRCFIDYVSEDELLPLEEYRQRRKNKMGS